MIGLFLILLHSYLFHGEPSAAFALRVSSDYTYTYTYQSLSSFLPHKFLFSTRDLTKASRVSLQFRQKQSSEKLIAIVSTTSVVLRTLQVYRQPSYTNTGAL